MTILVALDVETTGLDPLVDGIWEFAAIRREEDGSETRHHRFVRHPARLIPCMPERFRVDREERFREEEAISQAEFAGCLNALLSGTPDIIGACPWFDEGFLRQLVPQIWDYHLSDVECIASGHLKRRIKGLSNAAAAFGITNPAPHTAMGDAETALRLYDAVMGAPAELDDARAKVAAVEAVIAPWSSRASRKIRAALTQ